MMPLAPAAAARSRRCLQADLFGNPRATPVAAVRERPVEGEDDALGTRSRRTFEALHHRVAAPRPVQLEENLVVHRRHFLDRLAGKGTQAHHDSAICRGARDGNLTVGVHRLHARRRNDDRHRHLLTHHARRLVATRMQIGDVRCEAELVERVEVVAEREALLRPADDGAVHRFGQTTLRPALCDGDGFEPRVAHGGTA